MSINNNPLAVVMCLHGCGRLAKYGRRVCLACAAEHAPKER